MARFFRKKKSCKFTAEGATGIDYKDLETSRSSLEDIFVGLVEGRA